MILQQTTDNLEQIGATIARGGVIAFRTDTFYGLGADPFNLSAVQKIRELKGREDDKPILVVISHPEEINRLIPHRSKAFEDLTRRFWPGALTIIGRAADDLSEELTAGTQTVGVRLPNDDRVRALIDACGGVLTATSANVSGHPPSRTAVEVEKYFGQQIDVIVDGGVTTVESPSSVVDATTDEIKLVREGVVAWIDILSALDS
ncbi:MAG TPA: L-threonylcarbamoyladenylate synthase [Pyrinomonadaceae bacterium]|nr:L-threonylcarbamoyladenylate synthase [Pyrinomonadaceae bacterium]